MSRDRWKRPGSSTAAVKARAVSWPTPGMSINRRQAADALAIFLMSPSIATTAARTAARAATRPFMAADRPGMPSLACSACHEGWAQRAWQPDAEHHGKTADLVLESDPLADQLFASDDRRADGMCRQGLHVNGLEEAGTGKVRQAACIVAVGLVRCQRL